MSALKVFQVSAAQMAAEMPSEMELRARAICRVIRDYKFAADDTFHYAIANVFSKNWHSALTLEQVASFAQAEYNNKALTETAAEAFVRKLNACVRAGMLRSRVSQGKRRYELAI